MSSLTRTHAQSYGPASRQSLWSLRVQTSCAASHSLRKVWSNFVLSTVKTEFSDTDTAISGIAEAWISISTSASLQPVQETSL